MENQSKLKLCPFCGESGHLEINRGFFNGKSVHFAYIQCQTCYARSKRYEVEYNGRDKAIEKAIAAWNRRIGECDIPARGSEND